MTARIGGYQWAWSVAAGDLPGSGDPVPITWPGITATQSFLRVRIKP